MIICPWSCFEHISTYLCACEAETQCYRDICNHHAEKDKEIDSGHSAAAAVSQTALGQRSYHVDLQRPKL